MQAVRPAEHQQRHSSPRAFNHYRQEPPAEQYHQVSLLSGCLYHQCPNHNLHIEYLYF